MKTILEGPSDHKRLEVRERPNRAPVMFQQWDHLLFLHWEFDPSYIQSTLPEGLFVDTYNSKAYIGLIPFFMNNVRPAYVPAVPMVSNFLETNLRTYVYDKHGNPGIWFYSLEANQWLAVQIAKKLFYLPYFMSGMKASIDGADGSIVYTHRRQNSPEDFLSTFTYQPVGKPFHALPGTLEFFLVERYLLFAKSNKGLKSGRVHHQPYKISKTYVRNWDSHIFELNNLERPKREPDHLLMANAVDVDIFWIEPL